MAYDWRHVADLDSLCQRLATRYDEAEPGSPERLLCARWVGRLQRELDRYIAQHSQAGRPTTSV